MSYCRFSSDGFKSDVYLYGSVDNDYVLHVASSRIKNIDELSKNLDLKIEKDNIKSFMKQYTKLLQKINKHAIHENINGKYDGQIFSFKTSKETIKMLKTLKKEGYHVPKNVFKMLKEESLET